MNDGHEQRSRETSGKAFALNEATQIVINGDAYKLLRDILSEAHIDAQRRLREINLANGALDTALLTAMRKETSGATTANTSS